MEISPAARGELAPGGKLRIGLNYGNFLLVLKDGPGGEPRGIAPDLGRELAKRLGVPLEFLKFEQAGKLADAVKDGKCDVGFLGARKVTGISRYAAVKAISFARCGSAPRKPTSHLPSLTASASSA